MDGIRGSRFVELALVGAIGMATCLALSLFVTGLRHPIAVALSPFVAVGVYRAAAYPWRPWQLVAILVLLVVLLVPFLISPSYLERLF
jgi:hypothetical protein